MKTTLKIPSHSLLLGRFPLQFFQKILSPPPFCPLLLLEILSLFHPPLYWSPLQNAKNSLPPSETLKLLLGCQYGHIIVRSFLHTKVIRCVKVFLLLTSTRNTKDFAKIVYNLSFYFENLGTGIFNEHLSVPVSITKNFHCNLAFLF